MNTHSVILTLEDGDGKRGDVEFLLKATEPSDNVMAFGLLMWDIVSGITSAGLVSGYIKLYLPKAAEDNPLPGHADLEELARFVFRGVDGILRRLSIPAFLESKLLPGTDQVDLTDEAIAAFVTAMTGGLDVIDVYGVSEGIVQPCGIRGQDLESVMSAVESWGKRKG